MSGKYFKAKGTAEQEEAEAIRKEYESVIREQRQRITTLRDENAELAKKLEGFERYSCEITGVLADARIKANDIIAAAKKRAEKISADAENAKNENEKTVQYYRSSLKELESRSERILASIQNELSKERQRAFSIAASQ